jgi:hypothetical protein
MSLVTFSTANAWSNLENVKELNASERCADGNENPKLEGSTRSRNITVISDSELEERKDSRLEVTNARKLLPHGTNFGLGCSKSGYNPWIIQK